MTLNSKTAIVLGGTATHIPLIENLKKRGIDTILIDYLDNPPAKDFADKHVKESALDREKVLEIAKERKADLVLSCCIDRTISICSYVADKLGLSFPFDYKTSLMLTDKKSMKKFMSQNDIPTGSFLEVEMGQPLSYSDYIFPVVVKPSDGEGSLGVSYVGSIEEIEEKLDHAYLNSKSKTVIVEEFYAGIEVQLDFYIQGGQATLLLSRRKIKKRTDEGHFITLGSLIPLSLKAEVKSRFEIIASKISKSFNIKNSPLLIQAYINGDEIKIIEFAARIGGQLSYQILKHQVGIDIIDTFINGVLGIKSDLTLKHSSKLMLTYIIYGNKGVFNGFESSKEVIDRNRADSFIVYRTKGTSIKGLSNARSRLGAITFTGCEMEELYEKYLATLGTLWARGDNNEDLINRDLLIDLKDLQDG